MTTPVKVSLVLASHSGNLAKGLTEVAGQMAPNVQVLPAGGTEEDRIGTSYDRIEQMINAARGDGKDVLVLSDLGSATMTAEAVIEGFEAGVLLAQAPFVEGAVAAAVAAEGGAELEAVAAAARAAIEEFAGAEPAAPAQTAEPAAKAPAAGEGITETLTLKNKLGLHARPAAMVARIAAEHDAKVTINGVDAASVLALMGLALPGGAEVELSASGNEAEAAMKALVPQFEEGFGEE